MALLNGNKNSLDISNINRNIAIYSMGLTKTEIFTDEQNRLAVMLKAIAHPARIAILQEIIKSNTCICGDLVDELGLAQPTISQHLKELKNAGLIQGTIEGVSVCYCINPPVWNELKEQMGGFFAAYDLKATCC
ncbi:DNA-binding transcriptional ArsR family regulator [Mucilaginibacter phyllosphaerae]|uniref:DNA-binding transcriptional ArsR family regulator n=2 Tax=Mucilaginibacter phyllosphaerae TaxID=1812349 RepID=A0ABR6IE07_9SPHI|nr:DNA-binding transcriptional ArsR family regulator [Mucilaginibacter phyllosphaerae]